MGIYESALDFVFANDNVRNVAISGAYGSGKSSVIESYKRKKHSGDKFLHISLTRFRPESNEMENEEVNGSAEDEERNELKVASDAVLEGKILNQLIHQIPAERIPLTNFRVKKRASLVRNIGTSFFAVIGLALGLYAFYFSRWTSFVDILTVERLSNVLRVTTYAEMRFVAGVTFLFVIGILIYRLAKLQESHSIVKKATISGLEIEIFKDSNDSYFDKYLNEVLYLFKQIEEDVIIFEDIDRYDSSKIFERLHEVNRLVKPCLHYSYRYSN